MFGKQVLGHSIASLYLLAIIGVPASGQCLEYARLAPTGDQFPTYGDSLSVSGEWLAIGASQDYHQSGGAYPAFAAANYKTGSVYIRKLVDGEWVDTQKLRSPEPNPFGGDDYGLAVAMQGRTLLVGAPNHELPENHRGVVYVYRRPGTSWLLSARLTVSDVPPGGELFGSSISLDGDVAAIGAPGTSNARGVVYVFERTNNEWVQTARLQPSNAETNDRFGTTVDIQGLTVLIGAKDAESGWGAAWAFEKVNGEWTESARFVPSDHSPSDAFGTDVCLDGDQALISGQMDDLGRVYVFRRRFGVWEETETYSFTTHDGSSGNHGFGGSIEVDGNTAIISAPHADRLPPGREGRVYCFYRQSGVFTQGPQFAPSISDNPDQFGGAIALSNGVAAVQTVTRTFDANVGEVCLFDVSGCGPFLELRATCPEGGRLRVDWSNATPGGDVALFFSPSKGKSFVGPGVPCQGVPLNLDPEGLVLFYMGPAGEEGHRSLYVKAGKEACGGFVQLLNLSTCRTSNTAQLK